MTALLLAAALFQSADYETENAAADVRPEGGDPAATFTPPTVAATELVRETVLPAADVADLRRRVGEVRSVRGTVASVYVAGPNGPVILNFDADFRRAFQAVIFKENFAKWNDRPAEEIGPLYEDREVVVDGIITEYRDLPQIKLSHPWQVRVVE